MENDKVVTHGDISSMKDDIAKLGQKMDLIYYALQGNDMTKDGGLIRRIGDLENENHQLHKSMLQQTQALREEIEELKIAKTKSDLYEKWLWRIITGGVALMLEYLFQKFLK